MPGYLFDFSAGKTFGDADDAKSFFTAFRLSATAGFLCWQTDHGRQNDAFYYGVQGEFFYRKLSLQTTWQGYYG